MAESTAPLPGAWAISALSWARATYGHAAGVFRSANAGDRAALEDLMAVTGGVKVSAHVPAATGAHKQNVVIRLGSRRDMVRRNLGRRHLDS